MSTEAERNSVSEAPDPVPASKLLPRFLFQLVLGPAVMWWGVVDLIEFRPASGRFVLAALLGGSYLCGRALIELFAARQGFDRFVLAMSGRSQRGVERWLRRPKMVTDYWLVIRDADALDTDLPIGAVRCSRRQADRMRDGVALAAFGTASRGRLVALTNGDETIWARVVRPVPADWELI